MIIYLKVISVMILILLVILWLEKRDKKIKNIDNNKNEDLEDTEEIVEKNTRKIEGAFGIRLGQDLSELNVCGMCGTNYMVVPPCPFREFKDYYVCVTPNTKKVYKIKTHKHFEYESDKNIEIDTISEIMNKLYNSLIMGEIEADARCIEVFESDLNVYIRYTDCELEKLSKEEIDFNNNIHKIREIQKIKDNPLAL